LAQEEEPEVPRAEEIAEEEIVGEEIGDMIAKPPEGRLARGERDAPAAFVRLREAGVLEVKAGDEWKHATLDECGQFLRKFWEDQHREMLNAGESALVLLPDGNHASRLFVSIEVEPTVPCQHVQWLMTVAAEQKYYKLELSDGARKLLAFLPTDRGDPPTLQEPPLELEILVHAVARAEQPAKWGDAEVMRPTEVRYKCGADEVASIRDVASYAGKAKAAAKDTPNRRVVGVIKAGNKVPFSKVLDLMETFEAAKFAGVDFFGVQIPPPKLRGAARLPYPSHNYATAAD
jgi:hypothetical protein